MQERWLEPTLRRSGTVGRLTFVVPIATLVVAMDQLAKWWALNALSDRVIDLVWTLRLRLVFNTGAAFGFGSRYTPLLAIGALVVVAVLLRTDRLLGARLPALGTALVLGGAVGNLVDRAFRPGGGFLGGAVVDFIDLQWWPVFNIADIAITSGAVLIALTMVDEPEDPEEPDGSGGSHGGADRTGVPDPADGGAP